MYKSRSLRQRPGYSKPAGHTYVRAKRHFDEKEKTFRLIDSMVPLEVDKKIVLSAYEIKDNARGYNLELYDCIIAATAVVNDMVLVTRNARHYPDKRIKVFIPQY